MSKDQPAVHLPIVKASSIAASSQPVVLCLITRVKNVWQAVELGMRLTIAENLPIKAEWSMESCWSWEVLLDPAGFPFWTSNAASALTAASSRLLCQHRWGLSCGAAPPKSSISRDGMRSPGEASLTYTRS